MSAVTHEHLAARRRETTARRREATRSTGPAATPGGLDLGQVLVSTGKPLSDRTRAALEHHLGHDLAKVRVHDDSAAADVCAALGSEAFALGQHIYFAAGRYDSGTRAGRALLAHEVQHTLEAKESQSDDPAPASCREATADGAAGRDWGDALDRRTDTGAAGQLRSGTAPPDATTAADPVPHVTLPALHHRSSVAAGFRGTVHVVELLVRLMGTSLRADPDDRDGRVRGQLARLDEGSRDAVAERARAVLSATEFGRLAAAFAKPDPQGAQLSTPAISAAADEATVAATGHDHEHEGADPQHEHEHEGADPQHEHGPATEHHEHGHGQAEHGPAPRQAGQQPTGSGEVTVGTDPHADDAPAPAPQAGIPETEQTASTSAPNAAPERPTISQPDAGVAEVAAGASAVGGAVAAPPQSAPPPEPQAPEDESAMAGAEHEARQAGPDDPPAAGAELGEDGASPAQESESEAAETDEWTVGGPEEASQGADEEPTTTADGPAMDRSPQETPLTMPPAPAGLAAAPSSGPGSPAPTVTIPEGQAAEPAAQEPGDITPAGAGADPTQAGSGEALNAGSTAGGACAPRQAAPAPQEEPPSGGCAAGSGPRVAAEAPPAAAPDVSGARPEQALAQVGSLPPSALASALPQVAGSATAQVAAQREAQAATPPTVQRPSGAAAGLDVSAPVPVLAPSPYSGPMSSQRVGADASRPPQPPPDAPVPAPGAPSPLQDAARPQLPGEQALSQDQVARAVESVDTLPVSDQQLQVDAGAVESVDTIGDADPALIERQRAALTTQTAAAARQGRQDVSAGMGEDAIRPHVPPGALTAASAPAPCPGLAPARPHPAPAAGRHAPAAVDAVAAERSGDQIRAGLEAASGGFAEARQRSEEDGRQAQTTFDQGVQEEVSISHEEQVRSRRAAIATSVRQRTEWSAEQRRAVEVSERDAESADDTGRRDVAARRREGRLTADGHLASGNADIRAERQRAEGTAREARARGRRESRGGFLSWLGSRVAAFIDGLREAIRTVFDAARRAVRGIISRVRDLATRAIRAARDLVVRAISLAGQALVAVGDVVLAAFPEVRDRFRRTIRRGVERATAAVNAAADALERGVQALLDGLARALDCALQYLEAGYLAALDLAGSVVRSALEAAQRFLDKLAEWADIVRDVAADPVGWLRALARSAISGVRNCLWDALKRAVREWFNSKVEMVVGVGRAVFDVLVRGCISLAQIGRMAWDGIKAALPGILIQLLIEKLVSLIVPAGAALMLIIDGLRAAWGAAGRILAAFQKFMAFLKAVRTGQGPGAFAELLASAAIAVLDFLSNFLVSRLRGAGQAVGSTLRALASRMGGMFRRVGGILARGARGAAGVVRRGLSAARRGVVALGRGAMSLAQRGASGLRRGLAKVGRLLTGLPGRARAWFGRQRDAWRRWRERRLQRRAANAQERLDRAVRTIRPAVARMLRRGVGGLLLRARLLTWRAQFWLRSLSIREHGDRLEIIARVNPWDQVANGVVPRGSILRSIIRRSMSGVLNHPDVQAAAERVIDAMIATEAGPAGSAPVQLGPQTLGSLGLIAARLNPRMPRQPTSSWRSFSYGQGLPLVMERRLRARDPREGVVRTPGMRGDYATIAGRLQPADYAALDQLAISGTVHPRLRANPALLTPISHLAYGFEGRRAAIAFGLTAMVADLATRGVTGPRGTPWSLVDLPQAPTGGGRAGRLLSGDRDLRGFTTRPGGRRLAGQARTDRAAEVRALKQREAQLAEVWLQVQMQAAGLECFSDQAAAEQWIYERLLRRLNLSLASAAALPGHALALLHRTPEGTP